MIKKVNINGFAWWLDINKQILSDTEDFKRFTHYVNLTPNEKRQIEDQLKWGH